MQTLDLEYLSEFGAFSRDSMIFRVSDIGKKLTISDNQMVLPKNVMLHLLDNASHSNQTTDAPDMSNYPFLIGKGNIRYMGHFTDIKSVNKDDLSKFSHRIYRPKLLETLTKFNKANRSNAIPAKHMDKVIGSRNVVLIMNYNPLYRIISTNNNNVSQYRRFETIFNTVLKQISITERSNFLVMKVPNDFTYSKSNLLAIINDGKVSNSKLLDDSHFYFFIISLVGLLIDHQSKVSLFTKAGNRVLNRLNIMLTHGNKSINFNIGTLAGLITSKQLVFRLLDQIVRLSKTSVKKTELQSIKDEFEDHPPEVADKKGNLSPTNPVPQKSVNSQEPESSVSLQGTTYDPENTEPDERNVLDHVTDSTTDFISNYENITPKQKQRALRLSERYKSIIVPTSSGDKTISSILATDVDMTVESTEFSIIKDQVPDESMARSTTTTFDKKYVDQLLQRDILSSLLAFQANGLFMTAYTETDEFNSFTNVKHIKVSFEDVNGKRHTVDFKLPIPDDDGYYLVNGVKLSMSKQLINIPICKISPTRVSLISNYNKTLVEKVTSVRNSLTPALRKQTTKLGIEMVPKINDFVGIDLPYDYKQIGTQYSTIDGEDYELFFDYYERYNHFKVKDEITDNIKKITFPKDEWPNIKKRLSSNLPLATLRSYDEYGKYNEHGVYETAWGQLVVVTNVVKLSKLEQYEFYDSMTDKQKLEVADAKEFEHVTLRAIDNLQIAKLETKYGTLVGRSKRDRANYIFMSKDNLCTVVNVKTDNIIEKDEAMFKYISSKVDITIPYEWCNQVILDKKLPVIFMLAYKFGFTATLDYLKLQYRFVPARQKNEMKSTEIFIQFQDGKLVFDRYPLANSLIVSGLRFFSTLKQYRFDQLDDIDVYYQLLADKGMSINYLKGIDAYFSFFIDPITRDVLQQMKEPTNTRDLLIRAVHMLVNDTDKPPSSISNFRLRSTEKLPSIVYNEISRQYANHINGNFKDASFSINTEAIFQRIIQDQTMNLKEETNPIHAMKETNRVAYTGFGGRSAESFVERDRKYPKDAVGILGESTTDSGSVGMITTLSGDPKISNLRGLLDTESTDKNSSTRLLSDTTSLLPGVTHDD